MTTAEYYKKSQDVLKKHQFEAYNIYVFKATLKHYGYDRLCKLLKLCSDQLIYCEETEQYEKCVHLLDLYNCIEAECKIEFV